MSKRKIITWSIILGIFVLLTVLYSTLFRIRTIEVDFVSGNLDYTQSEIVNASKIKTNSRILMLDKQKAIDNIENKFADIQVIQIKTCSISKIEIRVKKREKLYYSEIETEGTKKFFIFDKDLKVVDIVQGSLIVSDYIKLDAEAIQIDENTKLCDFVGTEKTKQILACFYESAFRTIPMSEEQLSENKIHTEIATKIKSVDLVINEEINRIIVTTFDNYVFDIMTPEQELARKLNICYSAKQTNELKNNPHKITIYSDINNEEHIIFTKLS